ncbi:LisH [Necator americanus]|uniref:LisH n=1 Tax=Necator americanus TaxID=51031 RepID=W2TWW9_NECAM|nr:LisH [Necator americanus]ETN85566.1 LisH [Necator americanus]
MKLVRRSDVFDCAYLGRARDMDSTGPQSHLVSAMSASAIHTTNIQGGVDELSEKQLTPEVLQILMTFLRKNGLSETEEALSKEANNLLVMSEDVARYCKRIPAPYEELVYKLERLGTAQQAHADSYVQLLM